MAVTRGKDDEAKFRALRKLAIDAQDHERELEFHAQEMRCRWFWRDRPWGLWVYEVIEAHPGDRGTWQTATRDVDRKAFDAFVVDKAKDPNDQNMVNVRRIDKRRVPAGSGRFWFGWAYGAVSDFGRSLIMPAAVWAGLIVIFAIIFLWPHPGAAYLEHPVATRSALFTCPPLTLPDDGQQKQQEQRIWPSICPNLEYGLRTLREGAGSTYQGIVSIVADRTCHEGMDESPVFEAFALSIKNAFVLINWDRAQAARRTYGCLYGFSDTNKRFPYVPGWTSFFSLLQNVLSAILIFLFLLALRNLLKLR